MSRNNNWFKFHFFTLFIRENDLNSQEIEKETICALMKITSLVSYNLLWKN